MRKFSRFSRWDSTRRKSRKVSVQATLLVVRRTLGDLHTLHDLVIDTTSALFDELVSLDADVEDLGAFDAELDELLDRSIDNISCGL